MRRLTVKDSKTEEDLGDVFAWRGVGERSNWAGWAITEICKAQRISSTPCLAKRQGFLSACLNILQSHP